MRKLSEEELNDILKKQLGKLGTWAGAIGGFSGGGLLSGLGGALGGSSGARWAAGKLRSGEYKDSLDLPYPMEDAIKTAASILGAMPKFFEWIHDNCHHDAPFVAALVGSGFFAMNPTIICLEFAPTETTATTVHLSALAKEGLINQKSAEKAVNQLKGLLLAECSR